MSTCTNVVPANIPYSDFLEMVYPFKNFSSLIGRIVSLWRNFGYSDYAMDEEVHLLVVSVREALHLITRLEQRDLVISNRHCNRQRFIVYLDNTCLKLDRFYVYLLEHLRARTPSEHRLWLQYNLASVPL